MPDISRVYPEPQQSVVREAQRYLYHEPRPIKKVWVPNPYMPWGGDAAVISAELNRDPKAAHILGLAYAITGQQKYKDKVIDICNAWAMTNGGCTTRWWNQSTALHYVDKLQRMLCGAILCYYRDARFEAWVKDAYKPVAESIMERPNNWGAWGILGYTLSCHYLGYGMAFAEDSIRDWVDNAVGPKKWIADDHELWRENLRHNSGIWYTYFALAPLSKAIAILHEYHNIDLRSIVRMPMLKHWEWCQRPEDWPYRKLWGPVGFAQNLIWSGAKNLKAPDTNSGWPWNMFEGYSAYDTKIPRPEKGAKAWGHTWCYGTLSREKGKFVFA